MPNTPSRSPVRRGWRWRSAALAMAVLAAVLGLQIAAAGPAAAHTRLVSSSPAKGAKLDRLPQVVRLTFSQEVSQPAVVVVTGPDGTEVSTGKAAIADATLSRPVAGETGAAAGRYTIRYRVASADGHPVSGTIAFTLSTLPAPPSMPATDAVPAQPDPGLAASSPATSAELNTEAAASAAPDPPGGVGGIMALVVGLAVALGLAVISVGWLVSRAPAT